MRHLPLTVLLFLVAPLAHADRAEDRRFPDPYFAADEIPASTIPEPARPGSAGWNAQLDLVRAAQKNIPSSDAFAIAREAKVQLPLMTDALTGHPTAKTNPKLFAWLGRVSSTSYHISEQAKVHFHTPRPYASAPDIHNLVPALNNGSYPSGHTTFAYTMAGVLSTVYPEQKQALYTRASEIARHRVQAGVHFPQDLAGGEALAAAVVAKLEQNPAYVADREAAKKEIAATTR